MRSGYFSVSHEHAQFAFECIRGLWIFGRLHLRDQPVKPGAKRRIRHLVLIAECLKRTGTENKPPQKLLIFLVHRFKPGRQRRFHKINLHLKFINVNKI